MTSKKKPVSLFQRCRKRFLDTVGSVPSTVLAGAAGAAGAAIITLGIPAAVTGVMAATQKEELVAVFSEPADEASAANSCGGGKLTLPVALGQLRQPDPRPHEKQVEFWTRSKSGHTVVASVHDETGVGHGEIYGFEKPRNTMADFDTISASFDGSVVGRGTYVLERHYTNGAADPWWRGRHTFYDCHHNVMLTCPIVLGPPALRKQMEADQWLDTTCWVETSPTRTTMQRTASK